MKTYQTEHKSVNGNDVVFPHHVSQSINALNKGGETQKIELTAPK